MEFPHINDSKFPNLNNVDVYKFQNDFDYARWQGKVSIKLLNVLWNSNYADVPGFENDVKRDQWFDSQDGMVQTLETAFNITPDNIVKIPIPYNDAYRYNYLMVDMPMQTSVANPIDYENETTRVKRWYYFIDSMTQYAPNTTELYVTLDVWTTFSHTVDIPYLMLERGHAPMMQTNVDTYLANPIANNEYLLAEDFNYGANRIVANTDYHPIGNGRKYVLFAVPIEQTQFANLGGSDLSGNSTPPTFSDTNERWGYQIVVNDYEWKYGDVSYENANLPISSMLNEDSVFNGNLAFAIPSENAQAFFNELANNCVHLLHAIQGVFVVASDMISLGTGFTFRGFTLYQANKQYITDNISLSKNDFGYDNKYKEITKLYTFPYSVIEITDDNGFVSEVRIENTGNIKLHKEISIAFPFVRYQTFFTGLNGNGSVNYTWKNIANSDVSKTIWEDDFSKFMMNWDIPTYAVFASAEQEYAVSNYAGIQARRQRAIIDYENAVRPANTAYENVDDQTDTMQANTATQNAANVAITNQNNTTATANTARQNTANTDITNQDNATASANTATQNAANSEIVIRSGATAIANQYTANTASSDNAQANIDKCYADYQADTNISAEIAFTRNDVMTATTALNNQASIDTVGIGAVGQTLSNPLNMPAALGSVIGSVIQANAATATCGIVIGNSWTQLLNVAIQNLHKCENAENNIKAVTGTNNVAHNEIVNRSQTCQVDNVTTQNTANTTITNENNTRRSNNTATQNAANVDITTNNNTQRTNNTATQNTANVTMNDATCLTMDNNADWTRKVSVVAAQNNLAQVQREVAAQYKNNRLGEPIKETNYSGDAYPDVFERRGVRMNIRTQTKAAIAQAGDAMLRYGYALHRIWDMSNGFHYGKHFTFWKAEDIWINEGTGLAGNSVNIIGDILLKGVTIWRNPDEIGKVSIYDNIPDTI